MSPASSQPSLQHNGSTTDITNLSLSVPDGDLHTDGTAKFPIAAIPPKKPLTPYMKFSKSVSACSCSCQYYFVQYFSAESTCFCIF